MKKLENVIVFAETIDEGRELLKYYNREISDAHPLEPRTYYRFGDNDNFGFIRECQGGYIGEWEGYRRLLFSEWKEEIRKDFLLSIKTYVVYAKSQEEAGKLREAQAEICGAPSKWNRALYPCWYRFSPADSDDRWGYSTSDTIYTVVENSINSFPFNHVQAKLTFEEWEWMINNKKENKMYMNNKTVSVSGSFSLLKAFEEELNNIGYQRTLINLDSDILNSTHLCTYEDYTYAFLNHPGGNSHTQRFHLPNEWEEALKEASEIKREEKISISGYIADFSKPGCVKFGCQEFTRSQVTVIHDCLDRSLLTPDLLKKIINRMIYV
jgi:hypothetical protein